MWFSTGRKCHLHENSSCQHVDSTPSKQGKWFPSRLVIAILRLVVGEKQQCWPPMQGSSLHQQWDARKMHRKAVMCTHRYKRAQHQPSSRRLLLCMIGSAITSLHMSHVTVNTYFCHDMDPLFFLLLLKPLWHKRGVLLGDATYNQRHRLMKEVFSWLIIPKDPTSPTSKTKTKFSRQLWLCFLMFLYITTIPGRMPLVLALEPYATTTTNGFFSSNYRT